MNHQRTFAQSPPAPPGYTHTGPAYPPPSGGFSQASYPPAGAGLSQVVYPSPQQWNSQFAPINSQGMGPGVVDGSNQLGNGFVVRPEQNTRSRVERHQENVMIASIVSALMCVLPLGIVSAFYYREAKQELLRGNTESAKAKTKIARNIATCAVWFGIMVWCYAIYRFFIPEFI